MCDVSGNVVGNNPHSGSVSDTARFPDGIPPTPTTQEDSDGAVPPVAGRRPPGASARAGPDPAPGVRRGAGQPGLHLRDRARPEGSVLRAPRLPVQSARST